MSAAPVSASNLDRYCRRAGDLTRFRLEHVDLLFDRANDNERGAPDQGLTRREAVSKLGHLPDASFDAVERPAVDA
jgi:hypothetical protein